LKFYTEKYGEFHGMVKFTAKICLQGFHQILVCIFPRLIQISMNFEFKLIFVNLFNCLMNSEKRKIYEQ
jgi:hypothetical protein